MRRLVFFAMLIVPAFLHSQQLPDTLFQPDIPNPEYHFGKGPVVFIDEGHNNYHTKDGRYRTFARLLERDGYKPVAYKGEFKQKDLEKGEIMVISNASPEENSSESRLSAFPEEEIMEIRQWVHNGGSLFLIADHMPAAGAAMDLAKAFGFEFSNGYAVYTGGGDWPVFTVEKGTLAECTITKGRNSEEAVERVATFSGQAFKIPEDAISILTFDENFMNFLPEAAGEFTENTTRFNAKGWSQGAYRKYGKGRVVAFGEAAMFSAQLIGPDKKKIGMNSDLETDNYQLLLNIIHWLDGIL